MFSGTRKSDDPIFWLIRDKPGGEGCGRVDDPLKGSMVGEAIDDLASVILVCIASVW